MERVVSGAALKYGDNINTDIISPPQYMELPIAEAAKYAMSAVDPDFSKRVRAGSVFVAEQNLGSGSSRETSPLTLKYLGIDAVVAASFARIFYRNCVNVGIPAIVCSGTNRIDDGDRLEINMDAGAITNITKGESYACDVAPPLVHEIIAVGGLVGYLEKNLRGGMDE
jgi:3-isopropylmalate/(R)-2-methylmalate dehydratase small subunit